MMKILFSIIPVLPHRTYIGQCYKSMTYRNLPVCDRSRDRSTDCFVQINYRIKRLWNYQTDFRYTTKRLSHTQVVR